MKGRLAEDSRHNRLLVEACLKNTRYKPDMAENGEIAVTKFKAGEYEQKRLVFNCT